MIPGSWLKKKLNLDTILQLHKTMTKKVLKESWCAFVRRCMEGDNLYVFSSNPNEVGLVKCGYAVVRKGQVVAVFMYLVDDPKIYDHFLNV